MKVEMPRGDLVDRLTNLHTRDFLPIQADLTHESGEVIRLVEPQYKWFVDRMRRWSYHFVPIGHVKGLSGGLGGTGHAIAVNQEGKWLAAEYEFPGGGKVVFLPPLQSTGNEVIAAEFLARRFPEEMGSTEPQWAGSIAIAGMSELATAIGDIDSKVAQFANEKSQLQSKYDDLREYRRLVFEYGKPLERIVARAFQQLGGSVLDKKYGDEEFVLKIGDKECIVEVKGVTGSAAKSHVHQLLGHLVTAGEDGRDRKGILVVNAWRELPLDGRRGPDKRTFPDNVLKFAMSNDIALITGEELLAALQGQLDGSHSGQDVLARLVATSGEFKLSL